MKILQKLLDDYKLRFRNVFKNVKGMEEELAEKVAAI